MRRGPRTGSKYRKLDLEDEGKKVLWRIANADARVIFEENDFEEHLCRNGLLPADFARLAHVSPGTVSKWLSGTNKLPEWVVALFEIFYEYQRIAVANLFRTSPLEEFRKDSEGSAEGE